MNDRCLICGLPLAGGETGECHSACAQALFRTEAVPSFACSYETLNRMAESIIRSRTSVPGVQPKLSLHLERDAEAGDRLTIIGLEGDYILKLPTPMYPELPEGEHFAMTLANLCGILMPKAALLLPDTESLMMT